MDSIKKAYKLGEYDESAAENSGESEGESEGDVIFQFVSKCDERGNISTHVKKDGSIAGGDVSQTIQRLQEMILILQSA